MSAEEVPLEIILYAVPFHFTSTLFPAVVNVESPFIVF